MKKEVKIDYLYLDLETCDRCIGTDEVLEEVIKEMTPTFSLAGYNIVYNKIKIENEAEAAKYYFVSSPTIRVNGFDICNDVIESDCGCCGEIAGAQVDCRTFEYEGQLFNVPPKAMLAEGILKKAFCSETKNYNSYKLSNNLQRFFKGKTKKKTCCCSDDSCC